MRLHEVALALLFFGVGIPRAQTPVEIPVASPPGKYFTSVDADFSVSLSCATVGASIYYTLDGSTPAPTAGGSTYVYSGPITISSTVALKAVAVKAGMVSSGLITEIYTEIAAPVAATPVFNPPGMAFMVVPLAVTITAPGSGMAAIHYTLDGTTPTTSSPIYGAPISISSTTTIKAIATLPGYIPSGVAVAAYTYLSVPQVKKAWYQDINGIGRITHAFLDFDRALASVPGKLSFIITDPGTGSQTERSPSGADILLSESQPHRVRVEFSEPFPYGLTSLSNSATSGKQFRQDNIPLPDAIFAVGDSVAPVILDASLSASSGEGGMAVDIRLSEPATWSGPDSTALLFRSRYGGAILSPRIESVVKLSDSRFRFSLRPSAAWNPSAGDSVALSLSARYVDASGNHVLHMRFRPLEGAIHILPPGKTGRSVSPARRPVWTWKRQDRRLDGARR